MFAAGLEQIKYRYRKERGYIRISSERRWWEQIAKGDDQDGHTKLESKNEDAIKIVQKVYNTRWARVEGQDKNNLQMPVEVRECAQKSKTRIHESKKICQT